eukprot:6506725-Pyramimonas_sp.AAC.1
MLRATVWMLRAIASGFQEEDRFEQQQLAEAQMRTALQGTVSWGQMEDAEHATEVDDMDFDWRVHVEKCAPGLQEHPQDCP